MARYTTELRDIVKSGLKIFDFEYPFYDPTKKSEFEQRFIDHFLFREIGVETVGKFQHYLKCKCNEVLPYYNEVLKTTLLDYEILYNYDMKETFEKTNTLTKATTGSMEQEGTTADNGTLNTVVDRTNDNTSTGNKTNTLESSTNHVEDTDVARGETTHETAKQDKTTTIDVDGKKISSDTPNGLLAMDDIKTHVYASKADIEDTTNKTVDAQTTTADKTGTSTDKTNTTASDVVNATSTDTTSTENNETVKETNNTDTQNNSTVTSNANTTQNETNNGNENYTLTRLGNIGVMHATDMIEKHIALQSKIRTVYTQFFNECEDLFMQVY